MELKCTLVLFGLFLLCCESRECDHGFIRINRICVDENECVTQSPCGDNAKCFNIIGSYYCTCDEGFRSKTPNFTATTGECVDINECIEETHVCSGDKVCVNIIGSYKCVCPKGYRETNRTDSGCTDVDECLSSVCGVHSICTNTPGSFFCTCYPGFNILDNGTCADENECVTQSPCGDNAKCINILGSYYCICDKGFRNPAIFTATTGQCVDINECTEETHECSGDMKCVNIIGSYKCVCPEGYHEANRTDSGCTDINECEDPGVCGTNAECVNLPGSYSCKCHQGYSNYGNDQSKCEEMVHFCL